VQIFTKEHAENLVLNAVCQLPNTFVELQDDGLGQIVLYTGLFRWKDGTVRDEPEQVVVTLPTGE
jgi:hypothetical protein